MPAWPGTLPQFVLQEGYSEGLGTALLRTAMDTGPAKRRPRFTAVPTPFKSVMVMNDAEIAIFQDFYHDDLAEGSLSFTFPHPRTGATVTVAFTAPPGPLTPEGAVTYFMPMQLEILP